MNEFKPGPGGPSTATVILSVAAIVAIVTTMAITHDLTSTLVVGGFITTFALQMSNRDRIDHVGKQMNGRMGELLEKTGETRELVGKAAGLVEGHAAGMVDEKGLEAARQSGPKGAA
jgi:hypothetical protein